MIDPKLKYKIMTVKLLEERFEGKKITGKCKHKLYFSSDDPCARCAYCTIDGNDYSESKEKPPVALPG